MFGGHPVADFDLDVSDFMSAKLAEHAAKKAKRGKLAIAARKSIPSPSIDLESGLVHPLSSVASRLLGQMQAAQKNVHTIVPHTMGQSRTLRQCVRRTIHAEMQSFKRAGNEAWRIERELYPASNNIEAVLMHARTNYEPPQGYPAKESDESAFDYYRMLDKMTSHVEWLGELPRRATQRLYRWAGGAYDVLRELESRNLEARAVAPLPKSLRLERFAQVVELRVKAKDFDFESIRAEVRKAFPFGDDWRFTIRVTSVDSFEESTERLLSVLQLRDVVTVINLAAVA
ncbi:hypothetical protein [Paraburkholderia bryophila]|uniref:Uncharacterized protein n=1 Tax=Paraburkholderia bryophila TaxID=420952 RepID=A0A7Y9WDC2_9BURK|nr:hypothetical protein [Paraburkholderia bryophila]NYH18777.1 hypothetical protein [Paraburkholderia bryophila]